MSKPVSLPVAQHQQLSYHSSRERELFKYLPSYLLERRNLPYVDRNTQSPESVAQPGPDSVLTALAQLGTLHLDSSRAFISLFGRHDQYILTEATRTLSLQDVTDSTAHRELWLGHCTISYERSLCSQFLDPTNDKLVVVPDTAQDEHYRDHQDVVNTAYVRFLANSPIISPKGVIIGAYTVVNDKPHEPLDSHLEKSLVDISKTIMDYLVATRAREQHARSERMMIGLRSFLDGKGSLRASWVTDNEDTFSPIEGFGEGHVNMEQQKKQISDNVNEAMDNKPPLRELPFRPSNFRSQRAHMLDAQSLQQRNLAPVNTNSRDIGSFDLKSAPSEINAKSVEISPKLAYKAQIKHAFSRASNIVRESIEVEAAVFFDANFGTQEVLVNVLQSDSESSGLETFSSTDDESQTKRKPLKRDLQKIVQNENAGKGTKNPCKVLGFSLSNASSLDQQSIEDENIALSEGFLGQLLRRYPRGKIFNYGEDGSISSEETGDSFFKPSFERNAGKKYKKTRKTTLRQDATLLLQLAPNARSIIFSPLWDSHKERWHSACISWTNIPHRILTPDDDLTFLFAFGHSLMAEIHRHEDQMAERAKRNLLSGISHELRSPLHGIFGTMDILNETAMNALQRGFMHTISSCAFTLLNSLDQLLMYASINDVPQNDQKAPPLRHNQFGPDVTFPLAGTDGDDAVQFDTAVENTIESVCAGYFFFDKDAENSIHFMADTAHTTSEPLGNRVIVIFDVNYNRSFSFLTRPGAWTVILTNVLGNALKFTRDGHVYVSLKSNPVQSDSAGPILQSDITVTVRDTGCGMSQEFLDHKLSKAFSQEDSLATGNGLGLNITGKMVDSLGGNIRINSEKGVGTEVVITVTLDHDMATTDPHDIQSRELLPSPSDFFARGKTIGIFGPDSSTADNYLFSSLKNLCQNWFHMDTRVAAPSREELGKCDYFILTQGLSDMSFLDSLFPDTGRILPPPIIVICSSPRAAHSMSSAVRRRQKRADVFEFISQPCGPRKLAKTLEICSRRQERRFDLMHENGAASKVQVRGPISSTPRELDRPLPLPLDIQEPLRQVVQVQATDQPSEPLETLLEVNTPASEDESQPLEPEKSQTVKTPSTVLIVDDNDINVRLLVAFMKRLGIQNLVARNGQEALHCFKKKASEIMIILMDISMPIMDGLEATRRIREVERMMEGKERTFICALTGVAQTDTEREAFGSGMDMFLTKPVRLNTLRPLIDERIHRSRYD